MHEPFATGSDIILRALRPDELAHVLAWEADPAIAAWILADAAEVHRHRMADPSFSYLAIVHDSRLVGFIVLGLESHGVRVEFRRIVIAERGRGLGRAAVAALPHFCHKRWGTTSLWLDVFADNVCARHIYAQCGWRETGTADNKGRALILMAFT